MTFPVVEAVSRGNNATNSTSHNVVMPATVNAGDLLIILFSTDGNPTHTRNNTLAQSFDFLFTGNNGSTNKITAWWKIADGTEGGATATFTTTSEMSCYQVYRISGHSGMPPMVSQAVTGSSTAPNSPSLTVPWGSADNLWLTVFGADANTADTGSFAYPTNYTTNGIYDEANNSAGCGLGSSYRTNAAATEDAGAFTMNASEQWVAFAIAVAPVGTPYVPIRRSKEEVAHPSGATVNKPIGTIEGDLMIALFARFGSTTQPTLPAGWTAITTGAHGSESVCFVVAYKVAGPSEGASYTFTNATEGTIITFYGQTVDDTDPVGPGSFNSGQGATATGTGITTEVDNALLIYYGTQTGEAGVPSGMTLIPEGVVDSTIFEQRIASAGATGNRTSALGGSVPWHAQLVAINPTPPAPTATPRFAAQLIG